MAQWINMIFFGTTDSYYRHQLHFFVRKIGPVHEAEPGLTAGRWQAGGRRNTGEFGFFKKSLYIERFDFLLRLTKVQHHYSSRNAFQVLFG